MAMGEREESRRLGKVFGLFAGAFAFFAMVVAVLAQLGLPETAIAFLIVLVTLLAYAVLGLANRTLNETEFFHGGRSVPAVFNGFATAAAFLSIGGFAGLAGVWFGDPEGALALMLGWMVGLAMIAVLIAPYFRKSGAATLPDFLAIRYGGRTIRAFAVILLLLVTFAGLAVAISAAATIAELFLGTRPTLAIGAAVAMVLFSSLFGGMRAAVFVAGAEAIVLLIGLLVPGVVLSAREYGFPLPQLTYGYALDEIATASGALVAIPGRFLPLPDLGSFNLFALGITAAAATASLPHLVMRSAAAYGMASARRSAAWAIAVAAAALLTAPAYAAFAKLAIFRDVVGADVESLPAWVLAYGKLGLVRICGFDAANVEAFRAACAATLGPDGILRPADIAVSADIVALAFADITDLPYVMSALLAAAGLAAALAGATALALAVANTIGHDVYGRLIAPKAPAGRRIILTRLVLILVTGFAGWLALTRVDAMVRIATLALPIAAAGLFPALVLGIWWRRANHAGALAGMAVGFGITAFYIAVVLSTGEPPAGFPTFGEVAVSPIAAAIYGLPIGFLVVVGVSLGSAGQSEERFQIVDAIRRPGRESVVDGGGIS